MNCSPPGSSIHGIFRARVLEWVAPSPGDLPHPGIEPKSPALQATLYRLSYQGNLEGILQAARFMLQVTLTLHTFTWETDEARN